MARVPPLRPVLDPGIRYGSGPGGAGGGFTPVATPPPTTLSYITDLTAATSLNSCWGIAVRSDHAFVTTEFTNRLTAVNLSLLPGGLSVTSSLSNANLNGGRGVAVNGQRAVVCAFTAGRVAHVNISNPASMSVVGSAVVPSPWAVAIQGNWAYVVSYAASNQFRVLNIAGSTPSIFATLNDSAFGFPASVAVHGNYAFVGSDTPNKGIIVVDISTPSAPTVVGTLTPSNYDNCWGIRMLDSEHVISTSWSRTELLRVTDISTPTAPAQVGTVTDVTQQAQWGLSMYRDLSGAYAFVVSGDTDSYALVDVNDPTAPSVIDTVANVASGNPLMIATYKTYGVATRGGLNRLEVVGLS